MYKNLQVLFDMTEERHICKLIENSVLLGKSMLQSISSLDCIALNILNKEVSSVFIFQTQATFLQWLLCYSAQTFA